MDWGKNEENIANFMHFRTQENVWMSIEQTEKYIVFTFNFMWWTNIFGFYLTSQRRGERESVWKESTHKIATFKCTLHVLFAIAASWNVLKNCCENSISYWNFIYVLVASKKVENQIFYHKLLNAVRKYGDMLALTKYLMQILFRVLLIIFMFSKL